MQGVTTAIVGFIFVCLAFPNLVKHRPQYYGAVVAVVLIILLDSLAMMTDPTSKFRVFAYFMTGLLQIVSIIVLILAAGGLTMGEFAGELANAYDVIRRGEDTKTTIVPLSGMKPVSAKPNQAAAKEDEGRVVYEIDPQTAEELRRKASEKPGPGEGTIPLE